MITTFLKQVWAGTIQEFQVYKHSPVRFFGYFSTVILSFLCQRLINYLAREGTEEGYVILMYSEFLQTIFFFGPAFIMISDLAKKRESKIQSLIMVNGMKRSAYIAKLLIPNYIFMIIIAAEKVYEFQHWYYTDLKPFYQVFLVYFALTVATVNLCFLISRCIRVQQTLTICIILWIMIPLTFWLFIREFPNDHIFPSLPLLLLNPTTQINHFFLDDSTPIFIAKVILIITIGLVYLGAYLLIEKIAEILKREKKMIEVQDPAQGLDLLEESPIDLEENLLARNLNRFEQQMANSNRRVAIEVSEIKKLYRGSKIPALNNISLKVFEKEIFCMIGHNGAGKTTLLSILSGLISQTDGDRDCHFYDSRSGLPSMGYCSQDNKALPENTIQENLMFWARIRGVSRKNLKSEVNTILHKLGLTAARHATISTLDIEGMKRLCIAIALLNNPEIIIMDEPTSGLDPASRRIIRGLIEQLKRDQKTVIFTTQFLDDAEHFVDRLAILSEGEIIELDEPEGIKQKYGTGYTLTISNHTDSDEIDKIFQGIIPSAERISDAKLNILKYALLLNEQNKFPKLFSELEKIPNLQLNLQRTSLEEAYKLFENNPRNQHIPNQPSEDFFKAKASSEKQFLQQLQSVIMYRFYRLIQSKKEIFMAFILPILLVITFIISLNSLQNSPTFDPKTEYNTALIFVFSVNLFLRFYVASISVECIITDRDQFKVLQKAMSMKSLPYWLGNFFVDFTLLSPLFLASVACEIITRGIAGSNLTVGFSFSHVLWSFYIIICSFNLSRWFSSSFYMPIALLFMYLFSLYLMDESGTPFGAFDTLEGALEFCLFFIPQLCLVPKPTKNVWINLLTTFIHFSYIVYKDSQPFYSKPKSTSPSPHSQEAESSKLVDQEIKRVQEAQDNQYYIKMVHCKKTYPKNRHEALEDLTFGVEPGQIFCLLGPNGAGKSTTLKTISNLLPLTSGSVQVNNQELSGSSDSEASLGLCLQSDMLWNLLTVEQHLETYAHLKGVSRENVQNHVEELIQALGLEPFRKKQVQHLSGGTKRKLSCALAIVGAPKLIVLDEPTTGVDPIGRNQIWTLIKNIAKERGSTVLISTHYMEDAELVADKLGILVNGKFKTIGNVLDIRTAEEQHFLTVEGVSGAFMQFLDSKVCEILPQATLTQDSNEEKRVYRVPSKAMKFSEICWQLESLARDKKISAFSINTKTLEQAFLEYAQEQN